MSTEKHPSVAAHLRLLERRADVVRSRLIRTIDALDNRRHRVTEMGTHAKKLLVPIVACVVGAAVVAVGVGFGLKAMFRARRRRSFEWRAKSAFGRLRVEKKAPYWQQLLQKAGLTLVTMAATELGRRVTKNALDGRTPDGRLLVGKALDAHHDALAAR
jgi:hypothetical protein